MFEYSLVFYQSQLVLGIFIAVLEAKQNGIKLFLILNRSVACKATSLFWSTFVSLSFPGNAPFGLCEPRYLILRGPAPLGGGGTHPNYLPLVEPHLLAKAQLWHRAPIANILTCNRVVTICRYEDGEQEHCLEMWDRDGKGMGWNDTPCSFETFFICEVWTNDPSAFLTLFRCFEFRLIISKMCLTTFLLSTSIQHALY